MKHHYQDAKVCPSSMDRKAPGPTHLEVSNESKTNAIIGPHHSTLESLETDRPQEGFANIVVRECRRSLRCNDLQASLDMDIGAVLKSIQSCSNPTGLFTGESSLPLRSAAAISCGAENSAALENSEFRCGHSDNASCQSAPAEASHPMTFEYGQRRRACSKPDA